MPSDLVDLLSARFAQAYDLEYGPEAGVATKRGSFIKDVVLPVGPAFTRGTKRIVFRLPFPSYEHPKTYTEAYAFPLRSVNGHSDDGGFEGLASQYLLRTFQEGEAGSWELVTSDGIFDADVEDFDPVGGFGRMGQDHPLRPYMRARERFVQLSQRNIVASVE